MRAFFSGIFLFVFAVAVSAQAGAGFDLSNYGVRLEPDKRLMIVLGALYSARATDASGNAVAIINPPLSDAGARFRTQLEADTTGIPADLRSRISQFVSAYKKRHSKLNDAELVGPFMSMAYTLTPAPDLYDPTVTADLPGELLDVLDFAPLAREFYRRSGVSAKLDDYIKQYRIESDGTLRSSLRDMISDTLDYLHTRPQLVYVEKKTVRIPNAKGKPSLERSELREHDRHFVIVPEMLAPAGNVTSLNIRDDYFVIVSPDKDLAQSEARRSFIQFVVDPLVLKNGNEVNTVKDGIKSLLDERRKTTPDISPDVYLAVTRSLVAAIEVRQDEYTRVNIATNQAREKLARQMSDDDRRKITGDLEKFRQALADESALLLSEAYERGAVLAFYFANELKGTEDSGFDIASSIREMIASLDATKEKDRLAENADARKRAIAARETRKNDPRSAGTTSENPVTTRLLEIQKTIDAKDLAKAAADLKTLLAANPSEPRIYYNIGRVAMLSARNLDDLDAQAQKLLEAKAAYTNVLNTATTATDKGLLSLTYVALGSIYESQSADDYAIKLYDKAIQLDDVTGGAFREAIAAKQRLLKNPK